MMKDKLFKICENLRIILFVFFCITHVMNISTSLIILFSKNVLCVCSAGIYCFSNCVATAMILFSFIRGKLNRNISAFIPILIFIFMGLQFLFFIWMNLIFLTFFNIQPIFGINFFSGIFQIIYTSLYNFLLSDKKLSELKKELVFNHSYQKVFSKEPEWIFIINDKKLFISSGDSKYNCLEMDCSSFFPNNLFQNAENQM